MDIIAKNINRHFIIEEAHSNSLQQQHLFTDYQELQNWTWLNGTNIEEFARILGFNAEAMERCYRTKSSWSLKSNKTQTKQKYHIKNRIRYYGNKRTQTHGFQGIQLRSKKE